MVLAHGSNDEYYKFRREELEALMRAGRKCGNAVIFALCG